MMNKILTIIFLLLSLQMAHAYGQDCPAPPDSLNTVGFNFVTSFEKITDQFALSGNCAKEQILGDIKNRLFMRNHDELRCSELLYCTPNKLSDEAVKNGKEILKEKLPRAILMSVLGKEWKENFEYNVLLSRYEKTHPQLCPEDKVESACEKDIRNVLLSSGVEKGPLDSESLNDFFKKDFLNSTKVKKIVKSSKELQKECQKKLSFTKICKLRDERVKEIDRCEKSSNGKGCLNQEQDSLARLLNSDKKRPEVFLAMEKELCTSSRMFYESKYVLVTNEKTQENVNKDNQSSTADRFGPDKTNVVPANREEPVKVEVLSNAATSSNHEESKETESESFSSSLANGINSFNSNNSNSNSNNIAASENKLNSDYATNFNSITAEAERIEKSQKEIAENNKQIEASKLNPADKKKYEEMAGVTSQIDELKAKLADMSKNVDDLKSEKAQAEKNVEALQKEKAMNELKKKIADLEAYKKKQTESYTTAREEEIYRSKVMAARTANDVTNAYANRVNEFDKGPAAYEKSAIANNLNAANYRGPASVGNSQGANTNSGIQLHSNGAGALATPESTVVYMTAGEFKNYPLHLNGNASPVEIEKMLLGNKGAAIIIGNDEQIIPEVIKGVVQLDENGYVKYKKIKISLVKNDKERDLSIAREISSTADLKRADQKKRELIRYQEMKKIKDLVK
jgi:hypothetical protein